MNRVISFLPKQLRLLFTKIFYYLDYFFSTKRVLYMRDFYLIKVPFYDLSVKVPSNYVSHLLVNYGYSWLTPMKVSGMGGMDFLWKTVDGKELCVLPEDRDYVIF